MSDQLQFVKRAVVERQAHGVIIMRRWRSTCGRYRVSESTWICGDVPVVFIAEHIDERGADVLSRHRKRHTAERACREHLKQSNETLDRGKRSSTSARKRRTTAPAGLAATAASSPGGCGFST